MAVITRTKANVCACVDLDVWKKLKAESDETEVTMSRIVNRALRTMYGLPRRKPYSRDGNGKQTPT